MSIEDITNGQIITTGPYYYGNTYDFTLTVNAAGGGGETPGRGVFGTNPKYNQWYHYILFFLGFGFIWMWF